MRSQYTKIILFSLLSLTTFAARAELGVGIILFGPTGLSTNYEMGGDHSLDTAWSWNIDDDEQKFYVHSTYLWHQKGRLKLDTLALDTYFGVGGRLISWDDPKGTDRDDEVALGIRGAGGVGYRFKNPDIGVFGEISVTMDLVPETDADLNLGVGARYYF